MDPLIEEQEPRPRRRKSVLFWLVGSSLLTAAVALLPGVTSWRETGMRSIREIADPAQPVERPAPRRAQDGLADPGLAGGTPLGETPDRRPSPPARIAPPERMAEAERSGFECLIEPSELVEIGSPLTGVIESVHVERSDIVKAGQVVAELESSVERAAVDLARARATMDGVLRARKAKLELGVRRKQRADKLFAKRALSADLKEQAETEAAVARIELEQAREDRQLASIELEQATSILRRRSIRTPVSGIVVERLMSAGEVVDEQTILRVAQLDPLRVEVILPAARFGSIAPGARAVVVPEHASEATHSATVTIVDRVIDAASGTFGVQLELPNPDYGIPSGLHCQVRFDGG